MPVSNRHNKHSCMLALEDGAVFVGRAVGAAGTRTGEVVFHTGMTGYQEVLTDPSYYGQIVTMTYPHIGNYGVTHEDVESASIHLRGFAVRDVPGTFSNHRAVGSLTEYLYSHDVVAISGIDTRALTKRIRRAGALRGAITTEVAEPRAAVQLARRAPSMHGADLVCHVAHGDTQPHSGASSPPCYAPATATNRRYNVIALDCGMKRSIVRRLEAAGCDVTVMPPTASAAEALERGPDGVFVSNGPGDPAAVESTIRLLQQLMHKTPVFGICLGHQLLALALGAKSYKLPFGHHGANHPVRNLDTGRIEITSQNHGFAVDVESLAATGARATHENGNDRTLEGFVHRELPLMAVQYHPEAAPGPHDSYYLFDCFGELLRTQRAPESLTPTR